MSGVKVIGAKCLKLLKNDRGQGYIDMIFKIAIIMALVMSFVALPAPFIKKQNLDHMAVSIARALETTGEINSDIVELIEEYEELTGLKPRIEWEGNFNASRRLQIRERFSVTLTDTVAIKVMKPSFASPVSIEIPISSTAKGVSEVYWKPGQI
ncbi:DUF4320 family protein [Anaerobacterium chartisolvens]|nr:DUF4320 family protein [Anaerobacterium chartisolvens]